MNCRAIQRRLISDRFAKGFCIPNYTPSGWFECDVFEITKSGFFREYEIKLSRSDFRADAAKRKSRPVYENGVWKEDVGGNKHELLAGHSLVGPSRFYYVSPLGVLKPEIIPAFAGWIEFEDVDDSNRPFGPVPHTRKEAPQLHRSKPLPEIRRHAESVCYWRFLKLFLRCDTNLAAEVEHATSGISTTSVNGAASLE